MQRLLWTGVAGGFLGILLVAPAAGQRPPAAPPLACAITVGEAGWNSPAPLEALAADSPANRPMLEIGRAANVALKPTPAVHYVQKPGQDGAADSFAGLVYFTVPAQGSYRFLSSEDPWYDVIDSNGGKEDPIARSHEKDCIGAVRKQIDYRLAPGTYALQITRTSTATLPLLLVRLP